jgi:AraC family transcriptional regulator of adaptative response / DNA-3-methyladenine glycosylase II
LGEPLETGIPGLTHVFPSAGRIAEAGVARLVRVGVPPRRAHAVAALAHAVLGGVLCLEPGSDVAATRRALLALSGVGERLATCIVMRALSWPDAFHTKDRALLARADAWRPWRAYAALHLVS